MSMRGKVPRQLYEIYAGIKCIGDMRIVEGDERTFRLCMIFQSDEKTPNVFGVILLTNEVEMGTDIDFILHPHETSLPYKVLAQTDMVGMVYRRQFGPRLGKVSKDIVDTLPILRDQYPSRRIPAGLPLRFRHEDPRWEWKLSELSELNKLVAPFWRDFKW